MAEFRPNDAQRSAILESGKNILVSAGAGSGKTTVLVERVLRMIVEERTDINELIIVTFTRAAASHMKEKIYGRLRAALEDDNVSEETREHLRGQLMKVFGARICTLDSLCMDIVREHFQSVDIDPGFRIADEAETELLMQDVLSEMIEAHYAEPTQEFIDFVNYYTDRNDARLDEIILTLYRFAQSHPDPEEWLAQSVLPYAHADLEGNVGDEKELAWLYEFGGFVNEEIDALRIMAEKGLAVCGLNYGPFAYEENFAAVLEKLRMLFGECFNNRGVLIGQILESWKSLPRVKKDEVSEELKNTAQELYGNIKKGLNKLQERFFYQTLEEMYADMKSCAEIVQTIVSLTLEFSGRLAAEKKARMIAGFNDVAHFALQVLVRKGENGQRCFTEAADSLARSVKEIIVDEYQDTNRLQDALIEALSSERFGRPNVFMVGDVKQSIYGFRLACPDLFIEKYSAYADGRGNGKRIILGENYRSRKQIVDFINLVFEKIMLPEVGGIDYTDGNQMKAGAEFPEEESVPEILFIEGSAGNGKDAESYEIARKIEELTQEHFITRGDGALRRIRYSDIAVLTRKTNNPRLEKMLADRHIPVQKSSSKGFFSSFEVRLALDLLRIVDNPRQDIPLAAVLVSPLTGLRADALAKIRAFSGKEKTASGLFDACRAFLQKDSGTAQILREFFERLEGWRERVLETGLRRFLDELLEESGLYECCLAMTYGEGRAANLDFLKTLADSFSRGSYSGLFNFIRYIEAVQKADKDFGSGKSSAGDDAVTMMTIHKSKGLEFPVVILADTGKQITDLESTGAVLLDDTLGIGIELRDPVQRTRRRTLMMETVSMKRKNALIAEEIRLLYVAMSRAKEKLIITGAKGKLSSRRREWSGEVPVFLPDPGTVRADNSYMFLLADAMKCADEKERKGFLWTVKDLEEVEIGRAYELFDETQRRRRIREVLAAAKEGGCSAEEAGIFSFAYPYESAVRAGVKITASQLENHESDREVKDENYRRFKRKESGLSGAERGNAYHKLLELIDFGAAEQLAPEELDRFCEGEIRRLEAGGYLSAEAAAAIEPEKIRTFLLSDIGMRMRKAYRNGTLRREQQFVMAAEIDGNPGGLLQGIIDAYFTEEGEKGRTVILVDYKTDRGRTEESFIKAYQGQQDAYAKACERALELPVSEKILYSLETGRQILLP